MANTKQNIIDSLKYALKKHDYNNHPAIIEDVLNDIYNQIIADAPKEHIDKFEFHTKNYEVAVSLNAASSRYYSTLPVAIINTRRPQHGVISINAKKATGFRYYPTTEREVRLSENLESGLYDRYYGYYLNRDTVWYTGMTADLATAGVRMLLAPQFKDFAATDEVPLPDGANYNMKQLAYDYITQTSIMDLQTQK